MNRTPLSFEFFPTRTEEGRKKVAITRQQLRQFNPEFFSCTFGAGGTTRDGTLQTVLDIMAEDTPAAPHLSCVGSSSEDITDILNTYRAHDIRHIVALRGDIPSGMGMMDGFRYANELVSFIREQHGDWFHIEVAAYPEYHPQAKSAQTDLDYFVQKCRAGADSAITQYFYNIDAYFAFVDAVRAKGIDIPIVPGIMPSPASAICAASPTCAALKYRVGCV